MKRIHLYAMEKLSQLETKIEALLQKLRVLEEENRRLKQEGDQKHGELERTIIQLREELERERNAKSDVVSRIDGLLDKLQDA